MNIGLTVSHGRVAPCFPGVELWIVSSGDDIEKKQVADTRNWPAMAWGSELMRHNVSVLLCAGVDHFLFGALQGYGIEVIPDAEGSPAKVIEHWQKGALKVSNIWRPHRQGVFSGGSRRRKGRRGGRYGN